MADEPVRSRTARRLAEEALVRVVHHYGGTPEFVLLGGLVPELLCSSSGVIHAGTTDVDVQVNLEIAAGAVQARRLEQALANAEFEVDPKDIWRWQAEVDGRRAVVKFELLADLDYAAQEATVAFDECDRLGAVNLRGTGFAAQDFAPISMRARIGGMPYEVSVNVAGTAGFLLAKTAAAYGRRHEKDWYDIAFVLLHNDLGGPDQAARATRFRFEGQFVGSIRTALDDLLANFEHPDHQGPAAYARQRLIDDPGADDAQLRTDAVLAVRAFHAGLTGS
ncbi:MAG TPA: hypothetical protein VFW24_06895 [Acidimicrobiales bacterium]|nr:hypothetical protein [Acidimicrobiales bacterium]